MRLGVFFIFASASAGMFFFVDWYRDVFGIAMAFFSMLALAQEFWDRKEEELKHDG